MTSIQKLLGHRHLNTTMIYARVHDRTVAGEYYAAMAQIEQNLELGFTAAGDNVTEPIRAAERLSLLALVNQLADPQLDPDRRLKLVDQLRGLLQADTAAAQPPETEPDTLPLAMQQEPALVSLAEVW